MSQSLSLETASQLIHDSLSSLARSGTLEANVGEMKNDSVLLGAGSPLDSIGFVTFISDLEDRVQQKTQREFYLVLNEISEFNINSPNLTVGNLAQYLVKALK